MEAYAAKQIQKKKKQDARTAIQSSESTDSVVAQRNELEQEELNYYFGFPKPVKEIHAVGRDKSAILWWRYDFDDSRLTGWEVFRYRKAYNKQDEWSLKGSVNLSRVDNNRYVFENLTNNYMYRFSIKAINSKGSSPHSVFSDEVVVEATLPAGWFRYFDDSSRLFYYGNVKLHKTSWTRPELDPYFLEESIECNFSDVELTVLKEIYEEELAHYQKITIERFPVILRELGVYNDDFGSNTTDDQDKGYLIGVKNKDLHRTNKYLKTMNRIKRLFKGFSGDEEKICSWVDFMNVINYFKELYIENDRTLKQSNNSWFLSRLRINRSVINAARTNLFLKRKRIKNWFDFDF